MSGTIFIRFHEINDFSRISLGLLLDTCSVGSNLCLMFIWKGCQFRSYLVILLKDDMRISGTLFLLAEAFGFVGELRTRWIWTSVLAILGRPHASHTSHTSSHSFKCRNSEELSCMDNALETLAEHAEYFSSSSMLLP